MELMAGKPQLLFTKRLMDMKEGKNITEAGSPEQTDKAKEKDLAIRNFIASPAGQGAGLNRLHPTLAYFEAEKIMNSRGIGPMSVAQTMAIQSAEIHSLKINAPLEIKIGDEQGFAGVLRTLEQRDEVASGESQ